MLVIAKATQAKRQSLLGTALCMHCRKKCQWLSPEEVGEGKMVCMLGFLHIEMAAYECVGKILSGSGWDRMFAKSGVHTSGVALSLLGSKDIKRTRRAHHLTLAWLHILKQRAYEEFCATAPRPVISFEMWQQIHAGQSATFWFWLLVEKTLLTLSRFYRAQRSGDWILTKEALFDFCPLFFSFGHTNYARWLPVFLKDMAQLEFSHPEIHAEFMDGKFVVQRGDGKFSLMGLDQSQEHSIKYLKEDSGSKGLYNKPEEKDMIEMSRGEIIRIVNEFERMASPNASKRSSDHPECSRPEQKRFFTQLKALLDCVESGIVGNPFLEKTADLVTLDTGEVMPPAVHESLQSAIDRGQELFDSFIQERLLAPSKALSDTVPKITPYTFSNRPDISSKTKRKKVETSNRANESLVTRMFLSLQARPESDLHDFFRHENSREPPSLSANGKLLLKPKSAIVGCLPITPTTQSSHVNATAYLFDMAAVVHIVQPGRANTFEEYAATHLLPYLLSQVTPSTTRIDAIWDVYRADSLKTQTRENRCNNTTQRTRVGPKIPIPKGSSWIRFLEDSTNKSELFTFLGQEITKLSSNVDVEVVSTHHNMVLSNRGSNLHSTLTPCDHEEADIRIFLHLKHAADHGHTEACIRTVDSDVVVLAIHHFKELQLSSLWISFGTGKNRRLIPIHDVCSNLGEDRSNALLFLHAFSGCDVTSSFRGIGKKSVWSAWSNYPEFTAAFTEATMNPEHLKS
jgi:hypothetical protein